MVVSVRITQRLVQFNKGALITLVEDVIKASGLSPLAVDVGLWLAGRRTVAQLNGDYRGKKRPTDILSFANHKFAQPGQLTSITPAHAAADGVEGISSRALSDMMAVSASSGAYDGADALDLGDMIICPDYVKQQCARDSLDENQQYKVLAVHGLCHLLGFDHETDDDHTVMAAREAEVSRRSER